MLRIADDDSGVSSRLEAKSALSSGVIAPQIIIIFKLKASVSSEG